MLEVKAIPEEQIDQWPIAESGLPVRVVNSVEPTGAKTIRDLRNMGEQELLSLRSLGQVSLGHIREFFRICSSISRGVQQFQHIQDVFEIFLDQSELNVIAARYGMTSDSFYPTRNFVTLQEIGSQENKTRERIRQIEDAAKVKLQSRLAHVCLQPFYDFYVAYINAQGQVAAGSDFAPLRQRIEIDGMNPASVLLLLHDLDSERVAFRNGYFATLTESGLIDYEKNLVDVLGHYEEPVPLDMLCQQTAPESSLSRAAQLRRIAQVILDHTENIAATLDHRYFVHEKGIHTFIKEIMADMKLPAHYRDITNSLNEKLKPACRKGAGHILEMLNSDTRFARVERGIYDIKA